VTRLAVACLLACLTLAAPSGAGAKRVGLIRVFLTTSTSLVDGRQHLVIKDVTDKRARRIGSVAQVCTDVPGERQECIGTLALPLGRVTYAGSRRSARYYVFAVTGGTGTYAGSTGTYASQTIALDPRVEYLLVSLVP